MDQSVKILLFKVLSRHLLILEGQWQLNFLRESFIANLFAVLFEDILCLQDQLVLLIGLEHNITKMDSTLCTVNLMIHTHALESLLTNLVIKVAFGLLLIDLFLDLLLLKLGVSIVVEDDLGRLCVFLRVEVVEFAIDGLVSHALSAEVDHGHGGLGVCGQPLLGSGLPVAVEDVFEHIDQEVPVPHAGKVDSCAFLEVIVTALRISKVDQLVGDCDVEAVVGVVVEEEETDQEEEGLADCDEEQQWLNDVIELFHCVGSGSAVGNIEVRASEIKTLLSE